MSGLNEVIILKVESFLFCKICIMYFSLIIYGDDTIVVMKLKLKFPSKLKIGLKIGLKIRLEMKL